MLVLLAFVAAVLIYEVPNKHTQYISCLIQKFVENQGYICVQLAFHSEQTRSISSHIARRAS